MTLEIVLVYIMYENNFITYLKSESLHFSSKNNYEAVFSAKKIQKKKKCCFEIAEYEGMRPSITAWSHQY